MMNGTESTAKNDADIEVYLKEKVSDCFHCNGYYDHNHNQPLCRTCHLFLCPTVYSFYYTTIKKSQSCDSASESYDKSVQVASCLQCFSTEDTSRDLRRKLAELSAVQQTSFSSRSLLSLPNEVLTNLFKYLDDLSIWNVRGVCRRWKNIVDSEFREAQWRSFVKRRWPLFHPRHKAISWRSAYSKLFESSSCLYCLQNQIISRNLTMTKECTWRYIRLQNEMKNSCADPLDGISAVPLDSCLFNWQASIAGPRGSPYEGGLFFLHLQILPDYPLRPPLVHFTTKIFHPNISRHGDIGLDSINENWSLALTITKILISIQSLLTDPYSYVCMEPTIGKLYQQNRSLYEKIACLWTQKYAIYTII